ncbi:MAG: gamma-glutamyltransferase, partial [Actinobacteria bacterium]|nr:gamma-glutamyltransferase [Actinomycetota bacterium]
GGVPQCLNSSGRAGSGAGPMADALRAAGHTAVPFRDHIAAVTVPGCVDGWVALHDRYGALSLADVLAPAIDYAGNGFAPGFTSRLTRGVMGSLPGGDDYAAEGKLVRRSGVADALRAIASDGRDAFYLGSFGNGLRTLGDGLYSEGDLAARQVEWTDALGVDALGHRLWAAPPNSQGYLALAAAWILDGLDLPDDPDDPLWAHLLVEASRQAAFDRNAVLFDGADGHDLVSSERLGPRRDAIDSFAATDIADAYRGGGTMCMSTVDKARMGVTLIQSNASGWGCNIVEPTTRIFLHNRGMGFSLDPSHPAAMAPGKRPPHTLSPMLVTHPDGDLAIALGTMGGDSQPQVLLQLLVRMLVHGATPSQAVAAGRFALASTGPGGTGFDTWSHGGRVRVRIEANAPEAWAAGLVERGHVVEPAPAFDHGFGHAHAVTVDGEVLLGGADPRSRSGAACGF